MATDSQELLSRIAEVRQRLEGAQKTSTENRSQESGVRNQESASHRTSTDPCPLTPDSSNFDLLSSMLPPFQALEQQLVIGAQCAPLLDRTIGELADPAEDSGKPTRLPRQLTNRAHRLLERGRDLLAQLRTLDTELAAQAEPGEAFVESSDPQIAWHRDTVAMVDVVLHFVQAFPDAPSVQLRLCQGVEVVLEAVADRVEALSAALKQLREENGRIENLAELLLALESGKPIDLKPFLVLAESLLAEARQAAALRFLYPIEGQDSGSQAPTSPRRNLTFGLRTLDIRGVAHFVACHSLTVAQVVARVVGQDPELRSRPLEAILAALLHDVGMVRVPADILAKSGPLTDDQKRLVEGHTREGVELVGRLVLSGGFLAEAATGHHERLDGTGYPDGLRAAQISSLTRLLAVCDVYAAMCTPRPHRPGRETRTALTDTLLLAEQGLLDHVHAQRLLQLSFYPVGTAVELADGAFGIVVASNQVQPDLMAPARPVVALLTDSQGRTLPLPQHVDLAHCEGRSIVRSLSPLARRRILGKHRLVLTT
jgi:HD-GYP domain-containing protein (c-di-GMP phosphodiesterase class II)